MLPQQYCLRWKYHHSNLQTMFSQLLDRGCFCDVTLACEGRTIRAHRVVLCACSTYFDQLLTNCSTEKDPIIIMRDAKFDDVKCLIEFMYKGEINVEHGSLASLLKTAEELRIKGLAEVSWRDDENGGSQAGSDASGSNINNNNNNNNSVKNGNTIGNNGHSSSIKIVETKKLLAPSHRSLDASMTPLTVSSLESRISDSPNLPLLTPLAAGSPRNPANCASPINYIGNKKKRGRPPLDEEYDTFQQIPKISHVEGGAGSSTPFTSSSQLVAVMMDDSSNDQMREEQERHQQQQQLRLQQQHHHQALQAAAASFLEQQSRIVQPEVLQEMEFDEDTHIPRKLIPKLERPDTPHDYMSSAGPKFEYDEQSPPSPNDQNNSVFLTPQEQEEWKDVIKMNDYLTKGRRPQFWEEPFTKRVMDGIKNKTLEMKKAAKLLGVSYGTLYGRYRETYGCLKHPYRGPFMAASRINNMWPTSADAGVTTTTDIINMLQRGIITIQRAAELMHTTPSTISSYLEQLQEVAASQPDHEQLAALASNVAAAISSEDDRPSHPALSGLSLMSPQIEQQLRIKPEISVSALKKSSSSSSSSSPSVSTVFPSAATATTSSANSGSSSSSASSTVNSSLANALSATPSTSAT